MNRDYPNSRLAPGYWKDSTSRDLQQMRQQDTVSVQRSNNLTLRHMYLSHLPAFVGGGDHDLSLCISQVMHQNLYRQLSSNRRSKQLITLLTSLSPVFFLIP